MVGFIERYSFVNLQQYSKLVSKYFWSGANLLPSLFKSFENEHYKKFVRTIEPYLVYGIKFALDCYNGEFNFYIYTSAILLAFGICIQRSFAAKIQMIEADVSAAESKDRKESASEHLQRLKNKELTVALVNEALKSCVIVFSLFNYKWMLREEADLKDLSWSFMIEFLGSTENYKALVKNTLRPFFIGFNGNTTIMFSNWLADKITNTSSSYNPILVRSSAAFTGQLLKQRFSWEAAEAGLSEVKMPWESIVYYLKLVVFGSYNFVVGILNGFTNSYLSNTREAEFAFKYRLVNSYYHHELQEGNQAIQARPRSDAVRNVARIGTETILGMFDNAYFSTLSIFINYYIKANKEKIADPYLMLVISMTICSAVKRCFLEYILRKDNYKWGNEFYEKRVTEEYGEVNTPQAVAVIADSPGVASPTGSPPGRLRRESQTTPFNDLLRVPSELVKASMPRIASLRELVGRVASPLGLGSSTIIAGSPDTVAPPEIAAVVAADSEVSQALVRGEGAVQSEIRRRARRGKGQGEDAEGRGGNRIVHPPRI